MGVVNGSTGSSMSMRRKLSAALIAVAVPCLTASAQDDLSKVLEPFVQSHCISCHGEKKPKGDVSLTNPADLPKVRELPVWQSMLDQIEGRTMPPQDARQPTEAQRRQTVAALKAAIRRAGGIVDDEKWLAPSKGNHVDHVALFSGKPTGEPAASPARLWRLTGQAYEERIEGLIKHFRLGLKTYGDSRVTAPWNFTPQRDFSDYSWAHRVGETEVEFLLRNASTVAAAMIKRHSGSKPSAGGYIKELVELIQADKKAPGELAEAALAPAMKEILGRLPTDREKQRYGAFLRKNLAETGGAQTAEQMLIALLCSTEMIHRVEAPGIAGPPRMLDPRSLSRAIAFALTDRVPDEALIRAADEGRLKDAHGVADQVRRLLDDPAIAKPRILRFFREYFAYDSAPNVFKDEMTLQLIGVKGARGWNPDFYVSDADRIVLDALSADKEVLRTLLTTTQTFAMTVSPEDQRSTKGDAYRLKKVNFEADEQTLIRIYEIDIKTRADWHPDRRYEFPPGKRMGLLTHPAWLVAQSGNFDNHAIHRGRWIRERLLGGRIPEVPVTVNAMLPDEPHRTLRDRMVVTRQPYCWNCHKQMDPLGLPFEQFDHFGRFRTRESVLDVDATKDPRNLDKNGHPKRLKYREVALDTGGEVRGSIDPSLDGPVKDPFELIRKLANSEHVEQVFVRHAFRYFLGRNETLADGPALAAAHRAYRGSGGSMKALIVSLLTCDAFLNRVTKTEEKP